MPNLSPRRSYYSLVHPIERPDKIVEFLYSTHGSVPSHFKFPPLVGDNHTSFKRYQKLHLLTSLISCMWWTLRHSSPTWSSNQSQSLRQSQMHKKDGYVPAPKPVVQISRGVLVDVQVLSDSFWNLQTYHFRVICRNPRETIRTEYFLIPIGKNQGN